MDHLTAELAKLPETSRMEVRELGIVESHQGQDGHVDIAHWMHHLHGLLPDLVRGSYNVARANAPAGEPDGHRGRIVISAPGSVSAADAVIRRAAKLAAPDH